MLKTFKKNEMYIIVISFIVQLIKKKKVFNPDNKYAWNININIGFTGFNFPV